MSDLRALLLTPDFPPMTGGIQLVMRRLAENVERTELKVVTVGVAGSVDFDRGVPYEVIRIFKRGERNRLATLLLNARGLHEAARWSPDVVISGHVVAAPAALALRRIYGWPAMQYVHAEEFRDRPHLSSFAVRGADAVVAVSRYSADLTVRAGAAPARVRCIHPGVDPPPFTGEQKLPRPTLVTVARMRDREKGHDVVMRAMPLIRRRVPDAEWVVIGDGPLRGELEAAARADGSSDAVRFIGQVSDAERDRWVQRSHVFVLPNRAGEGFGIVFLEAASHRLPVVAGAVGGALDAVVHNETGLLVDANDPVAVGNAVSDLLLDPNRSVRMGQAGAERALGFSWKRHVGTVEDLLDELQTSADGRVTRSAHR